MFYIIQLTDGDTLEISEDAINIYPTIKTYIESYIELGADPGEFVVILNYSDPTFLYKVLTTDYLQKGYNLNEFVRIANAVDFLGNDDILEQLMKTLVDWFTDPSTLNKFKSQKERIKDIIFNLKEGAVYWLLQNSVIPEVEYTLKLEITSEKYDIAVSDDLSYLLLWGWNKEAFSDSVGIFFPGTGKGIIQFMTIYKDGQHFADITGVTGVDKPDKMIIDNNGIIYSISGKKIYRWAAPDYIQRPYKNIETEGDITLSNDAQRYASIAKNYTIGGQYQGLDQIIDVTTGRVLSTISPYNPPPLTNMPPITMAPLDIPGILIRPTLVPKPSPHIDLLSIEYTRHIPGNEQRKNHSVWIVDDNTQSWSDIPSSEVLVISHDENIIAAFGRPTSNDISIINLYKREGSEFVPITNAGNIAVRVPLAISKNLLLTMAKGNSKYNTEKQTRGDFPTPMGSAFRFDPIEDIIINAHNIKNNIIESSTGYQIQFPSTSGDFIEDVFSGPNNTYLFLIAPRIRGINDENIKLVKIRVQGYERLNDFLVAKLGE